MKLLVVCLGNICRSPMAEGALRARIEASPLAGTVEVDSAGTGDWHVGHPPDPRAVACALRHGVDISGLRARQLEAADAERFDWLLCADAANLRDVRRLAPTSAHPRVDLLLQWSGTGIDTGSGHGNGLSVPDPYTGGPEDFEHVWQLVNRAAQAVVQRMVDTPDYGIIGGSNE